MLTNMMLGEIIIIVSGFFLGYVFPDLVKETGMDPHISYSYISVLILGILPIIGYATREIWTQGTLSIAGITGFTESIFLWLTVTLLIGGFVRIIQYYLSNR